MKSLCERRGMILAGVLLLTLGAPAATRSESAHVGDRILVRVRAEVLTALGPDDSLGAVIRSGRRLAEITGRPQAASLDGLNLAYAADARPILRGVRTVEELQAHVEAVRARFPLRARRAPTEVRLPEELVGTYEVRLVDGVNAEAAVEAYRRDVNVAAASRSLRVSVMDVPNDPYYATSGSWGQAYDDMWALKHIGMEAAWDITHGSQDVVVAVVDTGADVWFHPDWFDVPTLSGADTNVWVNAAEDLNSDGIAECDDQGGGYCDWDGVDNDGNQLVDDVLGWSFVDDDSAPLDDSFSSHGTHVAGTIGARGDNGIGVTGVMRNVKIMAVQGLDHLGVGADGTIAMAIVYAADNGADVINASWGAFAAPDSWEHPVIQGAVDYAAGLGCVIVAAAGNGQPLPAGGVERVDIGDGGPGCGQDCGLFPASLDGTIAVAATDRSDTPCFFSNFGQRIDVAAPGCGVTTETVSNGFSPYWNILSLRTRFYVGSPPFPGAAVGPEPNVDDREYMRFAGTSMATPHVAGLAGLLLSHQPTLTAEQVRFVVRNSAVDVGSPGFDFDTGHGRIDAHQALLLSDTVVAGGFDELELEHVGVDTDGSTLNLVARGVRFEVSALVRNFGANPLSNVVVRLYKGDASLGVLLHEWTISALAGGAETLLTKRITLGPEDPLGVHELHVVVDPDGLLSELTTRNNDRKRSVRLVHYLADSHHVTRNDGPGTDPVDRGAGLGGNAAVWGRSVAATGVFAADFGVDGVAGTADDSAEVALTASQVSGNTRPAISGSRVVWREPGLGIFLYDLGADGLAGTGDDDGPTLIRVDAGTAGDSPSISGTRILYTKGAVVWLYDLGPDGLFGTGDDSGDIGAFPGAGATHGPHVDGTRLTGLNADDDVLFYDLGPDGVHGTGDDSGTVVLQSGAGFQIPNFDAVPRSAGGKIAWIYSALSGGSPLLFVHDLGADGLALTADDVGPVVLGQVGVTLFAVDRRVIVWNDASLGSAALMLHDLGPDERHGTPDDIGAFPVLPLEKPVLTQDALAGLLAFQYVPEDGGGSIGIGSLPIPARPAGLVASGGGLSIGLDWDASSDPTVETYNVYRSTVAGGPYQKIAGGVMTSDHADGAGLVADTTYHYVVTAVTAAGVESAYSLPDSGVLDDLGDAGDVADSLFVGRAGSSLVLSWGASCIAADTDFVVYGGTLGEASTLAPVACSTAGATTTVFVPAAGNRFFLVAPSTATREGSLGTSSDVVERPPSASACLPRSVAGCP